MVGLIAASLVLILVASITLGFGWLGANSALVWLSILCSAATAIVTLGGLFEEQADGGRRVGVRGPLGERPGRGELEWRRAASRRRRWLGPTRGSRDRVSPNDGEVVAVPERRKFHRPDCRYARVKGATRMAKSTARRRNFDACGICKP